MDTAPGYCQLGHDLPNLGASVDGLIGYAGASPVVLRLGLGLELRRRREAAEITVAQAAHALRASAAKISRMELGRVSFKERDVADLLALYRVNDPSERQTFLELARNASKPGWWQLYSDLLPTWFETYLGLEEAAAVIRAYELVYVPGLLQTRDYARTITELAPAQQPSDIERRVELRMRRQQLLTGPNPPALWAVIDEGALHRLVGGRDVARAQIAHLLEMNHLPNVALQIIPRTFASHPATGSPFTFLRFRQFGMPDIVYQEHMTGAVYLDKRSDVDHYQIAMDRMVSALDPPTMTAFALSRIYNQM